CIKNEVALIHFTNNDRKQGIDVLCFGDLWECKNCKCRVVLGLGNQILGLDIEKQNKILEKYEVIEVKR
ncbi:unnamed protein product, partial [marine sediment metagenome]